MDIQRELRVELLHVEVIQASDESASWAPYRLVQQAGDLRADLQLAGGIIYPGNTLGSTNAAPGILCFTCHLTLDNWKKMDGWMIIY